MKESIYVGILKMEEDEFVFRPGNFKIIDSKKLDIQFNFAFDWDLKKGHYTISLTVIYKYRFKTLDVELSKFVTTTTFEVKGLEAGPNNEGLGLNIPDFLILTFLNVAISSARGMLVYRLSGTILADFYLPLIDPNEFLSQIKRPDK